MGSHSPAEIEAGRTNALTRTTQLALFNMTDGYYDLANFDLSRALMSWSLLKEENRENKSIMRNYIKWSFSTSFLLLINAWQWFFAGIVLKRHANMTSQELQLMYYSIFFSFGSFLAGHMRGHYTVHEEESKKKGSLDNIKKTRREIWLMNTVSPELILKQQGQGGDHRVRANWFYEVFKSWEYKDDYGAISLFIEDRHFHSGFRNLFTYSLSDMAEELFSVTEIYYPSHIRQILTDLWNRDSSAVDVFPEDFWALEHVRLATDMHIRLLKGFTSKSPLKTAQIILLEALLDHHEQTGLKFIVKKAFNPFYTHIAELSSKD